jgi:hypothetical protein
VSGLITIGLLVCLIPFATTLYGQVYMPEWSNWLRLLHLQVAPVGAIHGAAPSGSGMTSPSLMPGGYLQTDRKENTVGVPPVRAMSVLTIR